MFKSILMVGVLSLLNQVGLAGQENVQSLKQQILVLAKRTTNLAVKPAEVRQELETLSIEIQKNSSPITENTWKTYAPGSWRQIWSDERDNSPPGSPALDLSNVYQHVRPDGRAVNFGIRLLPDGRKVTFALEALGSVSGNIQTTTILKGFARMSGLASGELLSLFTDEILNNSSTEFKEVNLPKFPNGPIGASSPLTILYLDETLKIGTAPNAFTANTELFIVERVGSVD